MEVLMKFLLTSGGISNKTIEDELKNLIDKDFKGLKMLFCTTASNYEGGDMNEWLIEDLEKLKNLGFKIDVYGQMYSILKVEILSGLEVV